MATPSPKFMRHANAFRLLSLRSDIDNIILELLGQFSLEKIYAEGDKDTYQSLVITLLVQFNAIFKIQRLTIPSENLQIGWYLGFLASWEVTLRTIEFVLHVIVEGRELLWETRLLRDRYLAQFLLSALVFLTHHPKIPSNRAKDRRDRFARIHRSLERVFDSYPGPESFLLLVCREVTDSLRTDPDGLALPPRLKAELPNLASELYPLAECLSSTYASTIIPPSGFPSDPSDWLLQFLALRDISQFVVGASVQYCVNRETRDVRLQSSSARTRNAVLHALENIRLPPHLSKPDLLSTFNEIFRVILPDSLNAERRPSSGSHIEEIEQEAIDILCARLSDRQIVHRVSDREVMHNISKITRNIELLDDPSGQYRSSRPKLYVVNCRKCHLAGDTQLRQTENLNFSSDTREVSEVILPARSRCGVCDEEITLMREISLARNIWDLLKPLEPNTDTISVERHITPQFQLLPPKVDSGMPFHSGYGNILSNNQRPIDAESSSSPYGHSGFSSMSPERSRSLPQALASPTSPGGFRQRLDTPQTEFSLEDFTSSDGASYFNAPQTGEPSQNPPTYGGEMPLSPELSLNARATNQSRLPSVSTVSFDPESSLTRSRTVPIVSPIERGKSKWRSKLSSSKKETKNSGDSSSLSSTTLEAQKLEEISLKSLITASKGSRGKGAKNIHVGLSQNSTYALFWTQASINIWDYSTSSAILGRTVLTESNCVLAAVTKLYLAYIIGTRDQKLTLRIVNLIQTSQPVIEYRMPSSPWCHSICISPKENYIVVGFDDAVVRFFNPSKSEEPREERLHKYHKDCKQCPPVETLSFSQDGLVLLASTRSPKNGMIQVYSWQMPSTEFQELVSCRYHVPLHESEDNGVSSATFRLGMGGEQHLVCLATWTQSGIPVLVQPQDGHRSEIRTDISSHQGKLGSRIQCASFSPTGRELAMVNDKGYLYHISNLNSNPLEVKRIATSKELTTKSEAFAMTFIPGGDEEAIILAWADSAKALGYVKKIPVRYGTNADVSMTPLTLIPTQSTTRYELPSEGREIPKQPAELNVTEVVSPNLLKILKGKERA